MISKTETQKQVAKQMMVATGFGDPDYPRNPYSLRILKTGKLNSIPEENYNVCLGILNYCMVPFREVESTEVSRLSRGKCNPDNGFVIVTPDEEVFTDFFQLINWINAKGLVPV